MIDDLMSLPDDKASEKINLFLKHKFVITSKCLPGDIFYRKCIKWHLKDLRKFAEDPKNYVEKFSDKELAEFNQEHGENISKNTNYTIKKEE